MRRGIGSGLRDANAMQRRLGMLVRPSQRIRGAGYHRNRNPGGIQKSEEQITRGLDESDSIDENSIRTGFRR